MSHHKQLMWLNKKMWVDFAWDFFLSSVFFLLECNWPKCYLFVKCDVLWWKEQMDGILTNGDSLLQGEVTCKRFFQVTSDQVTERSDDAAGDMAGLSTEVCKNKEHMDAEWTLFGILFFVLWFSFSCWSAIGHNVVFLWNVMFCCTTFAGFTQNKHGES